MHYFVVGPSWVGDMIMAQSLFIDLKRRDPFCRIDVLAPQWTFPLLDRMPQVYNGVSIPLGHGQLGLMKRLKLGRSLRSSRYDQAIVLPNSWKSALVPFFADIPLRTGFIGELRWGLLNDARKLDKAHLPMTVQRFVALGMDSQSELPPECPIPNLVVEPSSQSSVLAKFSPTLSKKGVLGLCPGAEFGPAKRWPDSYFSVIAREKIRQGWSVWIFGSEKDKDIAAQIVENAPGCENFTGCTSLSDAIDLMSLVDVVVTNDSGLMHVAAALSKNILAIYGSSNPKATPPLNQGAKIVSIDMDCAPCLNRTCKFDHYRCLREISPDRVLAELDRF